MTPDRGLNGAKGYREVARDILSLLPERSVVGAFQSGALAYYAGDNCTVVNLDGVVDHDAAIAIRRKRLGEYARYRGVGYFADWRSNLRAFHRIGGDEVARSAMTEIGSARKQGRDQTILFKIRWESIGPQ